MSHTTADHATPAVPDRPANHLAGETSPYLLQHLHNPVDWHPWGEPALARARAENKPIFLSIGYSACHWCHVMAHESFEDDATAAILNAHFIPIKVDREELPDVDELYMGAVQALAGQGGWPLNVFLTPTLEPFYGGTYFPPESRGGMPAFQQVLLALARMWDEQPEKLRQSAAEITAHVRRYAAATSGAAAPAAGAAALTPALLAGATAELAGEFDARWGGFGGAPKFPPSGALTLLLRQHHRTGDAHCREMAALTLDRMALGGMYDQLGGGFHRYSVDERWLVPHFEKMLYDNALLSAVYLEAWQLTGDALYRHVARQTLDYVRRELTDAGGAFHSAEDADSEGEEGRFYVWDPAEFDALLPADAAALLKDVFGVSAGGNFEGHNILYWPRDPHEVAKARGLSIAALLDRVHAAAAPLREYRARRVRPGRDDKVLTAWNGLMISSLARAAQLFGDPRDLLAAARAARFVLDHLRRDGALLRSYRAGVSKTPAYLEDYAAFGTALLDLYETTFAPEWLAEAMALTDALLAHFWDNDGGGFFATSAAHPPLPVRAKPAMDGATPAGNSLAALLLLRLARLADRADWRERGTAAVTRQAALLERAPRAFSHLLLAVDFLLAPPVELVIAGTPGAADTQALVRVAHTAYVPQRVLALAGAGALALPLLAGKTPVGGRAAAYVCRNSACQAPVTEPNALAAALRV